MWYVLSFLFWGIDWWTTAHAISNGAMEANPVASHFHGIIGVHGYAMLLIPLIAARAYIASSTDTTLVWRVARWVSRTIILFHIVVLLNNLYVISTL